MTRYHDMFPDRWLKAALLEGEPRTVKIKSVTCESFLKPNGKTENVWLLSLEKTDRELSLNKTNSRLLFAMLGEDTDDWTGRWVTLAPEPDDSGKSDDGLCIRVVGSPELKSPMEVMVKGAFGKKIMRVVRPTGKKAAPAPVETDANGEVVADFEDFDEPGPATIDDAQGANITAWVAEKGKTLLGFSGWLAKKGLYDGPIGQLPVSVYEQVIGDWTPNGKAATEQSGREALAEVAQELGGTMVEAAEAATEAANGNTVNVLWPSRHTAKSQEVGERTRYGELIAHYLTSTGDAGEQEGYAVFDDAGNECSSREVIPATVWGQTFQVVAVEAKAAEPETLSAAAKTKAKVKPEPAAAAGASDQEAEAELDRAIGPDADLGDPPVPDAAKKGTLTSLAIVCAELEKAGGWTEASWRGVISALTGGKRSRRELTEPEAKNALRSLRYELEQLTAKAS